MKYLLFFIFFFFWFQVSTLRYELELNKQKFTDLNKKKISDMEQLQRDYLDKINNLEKLVENQRAEIDFKNIEIMNSKSRRSMNNTTIQPQTNINHKNNLNDNEIYSIFQIPILKISEKYYGNNEKQTILKFFNVNQIIFHYAFCFREK